MEVHGDYNFTIDLPFEVLTKMEQVDLPPNMHIQYEKYLESKKDKDLKTFKRLKEREKYSANLIVLSEIISLMVTQDLSFEEAYEIRRDSIGEMLSQVDEIFSELFEEEQLVKLFEQLFQNIIKMAKKRETIVPEKELEERISVGIHDVDGRIVNSLDEYGIDYLVAEILADDEISTDIENKYVIPIQGILKEYITMFTEEDEEEYLDMFSELFIQSKEFTVYQVLMNSIVNNAIEKGIKFSESIKEMDRESLVKDAKEKILTAEGCNEYTEEIKNILKLILDEQTQ